MGIWYEDTGVLYFGTESGGYSSDQLLATSCTWVNSEVDVLKALEQ